MHTLIKTQLVRGNYIQKNGAHMGPLGSKGKMGYC
jgi:hypothetical protein